MAQITWRNINNPSFTGGNQAIAAGNELLTSGLSRLANVGKGLEEKQREENTAFALQDIQQLDQAGLDRALADPNYLPQSGNIDKIALRDTLAGQQRVIDQKADYAYDQAQKRTERADAPIEASLEALLAQNKLTEDAIAASGLSDANKADLYDALTKRTRSEQKYTREQEEIERRDTNLSDQKYISDTINASESKLLDVMSKKGNVDAAIFDIIEEARQRKSMDATETATLRDALVGLTNPTFSAPAQEQLEANIAIGTAEIEQDYLDQESKFNQLQSIVSSDVVDINSNEEVEAMGNFMGELDKTHGSESWLPSFKSKDAEGGIDLKQELEALRQLGGHSVASLRAATKIHQQSSDGAWGDPDTYMDAIRSTLKEWSENKEIGRVNQLAVEFVPAPKSNSRRDVIAYNQAVAAMAKSLRGRKGKDKLNRLVKAKEAELRNSRNTMQKRQIELRSKAIADLRKSIIRK